MEWVRQSLEQEEDLTEADMEGRFSKAFTDEVSAADMVELFNTNLRPAAPYEVSDYAGEDLQASATFTGAKGDPFVVQISTTADGTITGLLFTPDIEHEEATSIDEVEKRLDALPVDVNYLVTFDGKDVASSGAEDVAPIGSAFKLWVLLALVGQIDDGTLSWDDKLTVTSETKSLPSGELQDEPDGTTITIQDAAQKMIEISDNTATDLLIGAVGRDAIDALVPDHMRPVATTRQLFELVWGTGHDGLVDEYNAGDEAARAKILDSLTDLTVTANDIPMDTSQLEAPSWAASPQELTDVWGQLVEASADHPELDAILGANSGVPVEGYDPLWFKGGSLPGVVAGSWMGLTDSDQRVTVALIAGSTDASAMNDSTMELLLLGGDFLSVLAADSH